MAKYNYKQFIQAHKGKAMDYDGVAGCQCVDLCKYYLDEVFDLVPGAWGDAYYWYEGYNSIPTLKNNFKRIPNTPDFIPQKGDIMVWGQQLSQWGHVAICSGEGNTSWFNSWDNNWTGNHDATTKIKHDYNGVLGVLRPYNQEPITGKKDIDDSTPAAAPSENNNVTNLIKVIDISEYQTNVNYAKLAKEVDGVIIRVGYRGWGSGGTLVKDAMFDKHLKGVKDNKIPYGFYFFTQATTATEAKEEASYVYSLIKNTKPSIPVYIDVEDSGAGGGAGRADGLTKTQRTNIINTFCKEIESKGLKAGVYASESWFDWKFTTSKVDQYSIWVANYGVDNGKPNTKPNLSKYDGWQFTSCYSLSAISSGVDMSYFYNNYNNKIEKNQTLDTEPAEVKQEVTVKEEKVTEPYIVGKEYKLLVDLKVRAGAGTSCAWLDRSELSSYGKTHSYNQSKAVFKKGTIVEALDVKKNSQSEYWIKTYSGWLCATTGDSIYIK